MIRSNVGSVNRRKQAAFFCEKAEIIDKVFAGRRRRRIEQLTECYPEILVSASAVAGHSARLREVEVIFSTWDMPPLASTDWNRLPNLKAVFHAAGTVRYFAQPLMQRGIQVFSAWQANAIPVAEFTAAQIVLSGKGYFRNTAEYRLGMDEGVPFRGPGNFGETVALLGAGQIGRKVVELLRSFQLEVIVFDPFLSEEAARELGVEKVSLGDAFRRGLVVSNHLANVPATVRMIKRGHFESMRSNATFINTGRGATVDQEAVAHVFRERPDLTALLDVLAWGDEDRASRELLFELPNVRLSSHIAGSQGNEVVRMADYMIEEFQRWEQGLPLRFLITAGLLERMA